MTNEECRNAVASMETRLAALEAEVARLKRGPKYAAPDPVSSIADSIVAYAKTRRRCAVTSHELRTALGFGEDVHGMSIDAALKRIERGDYAGVEARREGDTLIPKAGSFSLWILHAPTSPSANGGAVSAG